MAEFLSGYDAGVIERSPVTHAGAGGERDRERSDAAGGADAGRAPVEPRGGRSERRAVCGSRPAPVGGRSGMAEAGPARAAAPRTAAARCGCCAWRSFGSGSPGAIRCDDRAPRRSWRAHLRPLLAHSARLRARPALIYGVAQEI